MATPASAQANNCVGDVGPAKSCSANDVSVADVLDNTVNVFQGGVPGTNKCFAGGKFSFTATFEVKTTSNKTRSNIGIFFGTGQNNALHGTCTDDILSPLHPCAPVNGVPSATCGSAQYEELDGAINGETTNSGTAGCGDTTSQDNSVFGAGTQAATLEVDNVTCPTNATSITLPVCTSWYQPTSTMPVCESPGPNYPWQPQAIAGTSSKCTCDTLTIPVQPISPKISVAKSCNTATSTGTGLTTCDAGAEGSQVVYTVTINNLTPASEGGVIIDQICDNRYGNIFTANGFTGQACPTGTVGKIDSTTCPPSPVDIANGGTGTCTFTVTQGEITSVTDHVTVTAHSDITTNASTSAISNDVTVTSTDAPTTAKTSLSSPTPVAACVSVRYTVKVQNTSAKDENVTLTQVGLPNQAGYVSALNDGHFADITQDHGSANVDGSVTGTTCGVQSGLAGQGTLSGSTGGGSFPALLAYGTGTAPTTDGGIYTCQFDGVICGNVTSFAGCASGLQATDTGVNANLTLDNFEVAGPGISFTETVNPFNTNICITPQ
jgi:hypothetical protein